MKQIDLYFNQNDRICPEYQSIASQQARPFSDHQRLLVQLGERLRLARKRRKLTTVRC